MAIRSYKEQWIAALKEAEDQALNDIANRIVADAQAKAPVFVGNLRASVARSAPKTEGQRRVVWVGFAGGHKDAFRYAMAAEKGRKPGKAPPVDALLRWVELKLHVGQTQSKKSGKWRKSRHPSREAQIRGVAFVVARKIGREGTPAHPFLLPAYERHGGRLLSTFRYRLEQLSWRLPPA